MTNKYIRKGSVIKTIDSDTNKILSTDKLSSINAAKKFSFQLQMKHKGKLGNGIVTVQK